MKQTELSFFSEPQALGTRVIKKTSVKRTAKALVEDTSFGVTVRPKVLTVTELTRRVASLLEGEIGEVWIEGEISNYRKQSSGHHYFTLKDAHAQIACVLFARTAASFSSLRLADGLAVEIQGSVSVHQPRGQYQLIIRVIQERGIGILQAKFEALKQKLAAEGLFEAMRKRPLPRFPQRIGIVTSPTGAAIADFLNVLHRRHPGLQVVIAPVRVQGRGAAEEIARAVEEFSDQTSSLGVVDVIVIARGGGSLEDLWEFNEEVVARAIVASSIPVMSAVGHEIDYTIADFAADFRAPTPSAAAEILAADAENLLDHARNLVKRLQRESILRQTHLLHRAREIENASLFKEPIRRCWELQQQLDYFVRVIDTALKRRFEQVRGASEMMKSRLLRHHPQILLKEITQKTKTAERTLKHLIAYQEQRFQSQFERLQASLKGLSPEATLARGFTIIRGEKGKIVSSSDHLNPQETLSIQFKDGSVDVVVKK